MPHIHELIDFTASAIIIYKNKVLLINHKTLKKWLPIGGHIELDEDIDQALLREIKEETGLEVEILAEKPNLPHSNGRFLYRPEYVDIHTITSTHRHIDFKYFARAKTNKVKLLETEHTAIKWFTEEELDDKEYNISESFKFILKEALEKYG